MLLVVQDKDASTGASRQWPQSGAGAGAVEGQPEGLDAMMLRHMMQAMRLGGKAGTVVTFAYCYPPAPASSGVWCNLKGESRTAKTLPMGSP